MPENTMPENRDSENPPEPRTLSGADFGEARRELSRIVIGPSQGNLRQALRKITEVSASALRVERVSVWRLVVDGRILMCEYLHQSGHQGVYEGTLLHARDFPEYFATLGLKRVVPMSDEDADSTLMELRDAYLKPLGIVSLLDAPILTGSDVCGVVCHESIGEAREWGARECEFAAAVAEAISRVHAEWYQMKLPRVAEEDPERILSLERMVTFGRLSSGMAHDFKNVLAIVSGYAELIGKLCGSPVPPDAGRIAGYAEGILAAAGQGERLSHDLLALGHEEPCRPGVLDLRAFLGEYKGILAMGARSGVDLIVEGGPAVSRVFIDKVYLERALLNLIINSGDAMPSGGKIRIRLFEADRVGEAGETDRFVVLEVADEGTGMTQEVKRRIFEPYFTTKGDKGTGLGMAIVRQIVSATGGFLEMDSEPGSGTVIRILLPRIGLAA